MKGMERTVENALSVIGFVMMCIGSAGADGEQLIASMMIAAIGMLILVKEGKKIDVPTDQSRTSIK